MNWNAFHSRLKSVEGARHNLMPSCPISYLEQFEMRFCRLPQSWRQMLETFNGAELFIDGLPMVTLFGLLLSPPLEELDWPNTCCLEHWHPLWKSAGRQGLPVARTCHDSFWILEGETLREWDSQYSEWLGDSLSLGSWMDRVIDDGMDLMG